MTETIINKLREIESQQNVRILLACETGSRAWGFPSPDSDYDVRFIYAHEPDWYVSVNDNEDQISIPISDELDITGWELRKTLRLLIKHNAALMERLQSPIIYMEKAGFKEEYFKLCQSHFSSISVMHHYLSMSKNYYEKCTSPEVKLKSLFYCIRTTLACHWILAYRTVPPMELKYLLKVVEKETMLVKRINELVVIKSTASEGYIHPVETMINEYLGRTIQASDEMIKELPGDKYPSEMLDTFLRKYYKP